MVRNVCGGGGGCGTIGLAGGLAFVNSGHSSSPSSFPMGCAPAGCFLRLPAWRPRRFLAAMYSGLLTGVTLFVSPFPFPRCDDALGWSGCMIIARRSSGEGEVLGADEVCRFCVTPIFPPINMWSG